MKVPYRLALMLAVSSAFLNGCGKDADNNNGVNGGAVNGAVCAAGQVLGPQNQCLTPTQGVSQGGQMYYNGAWIQVSCWAGTTITANGCQPTNGTCQNGQYGCTGYGSGYGGGYGGGGYQQQCQYGQQTYYNGVRWVCNGYYWVQQ